MHVETKDFAFDLPDGFVPAPDDVWSATHEGDRREITVGVHIAKEEAPIDEVLRTMCEMRIEVLRKDGAADHVMPITFENRDDLRTAWFATVGQNPLMSFCANTTHLDAVGGQRFVASFCVYQYFRPGVTPDANAFLDLAQRVAATVEPLPARRALARAQKQGDAVDSSRLYPYLVPAGYLESRDPGAAAPPAFGHGLYLAFAEDFDGAARVHFPEDLVALGTPAELLARAQKNLANVAAQQRITIRGFRGPRGHAAMLFGPDWLAASCLLLPTLHRFASAAIGVEAGPLCAMIPHRDTMVVFRNEDEAYRAEMRALVLENEAGASKPLTNGLFSVSADGVVPMDA